MPRLCALIFVFAGLFPAAAQNPFPDNFAGVGGSYLAGGTGISSIAGTGIYARLVNSASGTYAFTVVDAVPQTVKPFVIGTNAGAGIAQWLFTLAGVEFFTPNSAGVSWSGSNTGWNWSSGMLAVVPVKTSTWRILPSVRMVKSSVNNNAGYQVILGVGVGWGW
jgi:hypothetical protein